ncbi:hypothetical protein [Deferribacter abyssi]|uniref:hypothetical protein n=1 Tax=Deferribacter abyssi TaxID=213806 RepID=UPI003C1F72D6
MGKKVFWITTIVFSLIFIGILINKSMTNKKIFKQNNILLTKKLKIHELRDIGVTLLSPGELKKHDVKVKKSQKDIIKDGAVYDYSFGAYKISISKFIYGKANPNIETLQNWFIGQLQRESKKNSLHYTIKEENNKDWKIRIIKGDMQYKNLKYKVGFMAKLITGKKVFYQFIITYVKTNKNIQTFSEKIFNSIKVNY